MDSKDPSYVVVPTRDDLSTTTTSLVYRTRSLASSETWDYVRRSLPEAQAPRDGNEAVRAAFYRARALYASEIRHSVAVECIKHATLAVACMLTVTGALYVVAQLALTTDQYASPTTAPLITIACVVVLGGLALLLALYFAAGTPVCTEFVIKGAGLAEWRLVAFVWGGSTLRDATVSTRTTRDMEMKVVMAVNDNKGVPAFEDSDADYIGSNSTDGARDGHQESKSIGAALETGVSEAQLRTEAAALPVGIGVNWV